MDEVDKCGLKRWVIIWLSDENARQEPGGMITLAWPLRLDGGMMSPLISAVSV